MKNPLKTFTADSLAVRVYATHEELAADAARLAHEFLQQTVATQGHAAAILASAASQVRFLAALTALPGLDWSRVTLFHMDEYLGITADHPASFRRYMRERVESHVTPRVFHYLAGDALEPIKECERFTRLLRAQPIDLCCLGIGENGHVAFNDPPVAAFNDPLTVKIVKLDEACRMQQVGEGSFPNLGAVPQYALTLTVPALCSARKLLCVVPENRKAQAVRDALKGPITTACPSSILRQQGHATLFLDAESASLV
ncbi:MAG: glucosamine-6-phosphate deaminase [Verrucomicrobia bacterium]|nr:glucosamine-6-phosphate deaminase [Verrucomicrobiota bacterium]